jgi:phosphoglycolate phosphatase-like HAD superfamily hydrolase
VPIICATALPLALALPAVTPGQDPLPSWNDAGAQRAIVAFVERVTDEASPDFVPAPERIAAFDNDGTLWAEQPAYVQLLFAIDRVRALAPDHPEWRDTQPFKAVLEGDMETLAAGGEHAILELVMATHAGMTTDEFAAVVGDWLDTARHPTTGRPFTGMVYQPQIELLDYLRDNGFKTFIVSGGGVDFMRVFAEETYGIPPEQVVGSTIKVEYRVEDGTPVIDRLAEIGFIDDEEGKPVAIHSRVGRRPILAFGNSDGDFQMLEWTTAAAGPSLALIVRHDDPQREWAYDRDSPVGRLDRALDEANDRGWIVVSMQRDWSTILAPADPPTPDSHGERR